MTTKHKQGSDPIENMGKIHFYRMSLRPVWIFLGTPDSADTTSKFSDNLLCACAQHARGANVMDVVACRLSGASYTRRGNVIAHRIGKYFGSHLVFPPQ